MSNPFKPGAPRPQAARPLPLGDIRPAGWLYRQMYRDLEHGFAGHLDRLVPELFDGDDIYGQDRLTRKTGMKDLGTAHSSPLLAVPRSFIPVFLVRRSWP